MHHLLWGCLWFPSISSWQQSWLVFWLWLSGSTGASPCSSHPSATQWCGWISQIWNCRTHTFVGIAKMWIFRVLPPLKYCHFHLTIDLPSIQNPTHLENRNQDKQYPYRRTSSSRYSVDQITFGICYAEIIQQFGIMVLKLFVCFLSRWSRRGAEMFVQDKVSTLDYEQVMKFK